MSGVWESVRSIAPALAFLCLGVPLASLLDTLGFFDACVDALERRRDHIAVRDLWVLAAVTTAVLNLDTTIVLLTPLYLRLARRTNAEPLTLAVVPLLLAAFASSILPVSNLTTLIAVDRLDLGVGDVVGHLALPSVAACGVGWLVFRRGAPRHLGARPGAAPDRHALVTGGAVVVGLLVAFVAGPAVGLAPWMALVAADAVLVVLTRTLPWRDVPLATAAGVAVLVAFVADVAPADVIRSLVAASTPLGTSAVTVGAGAVAAVVNNLPAVLVAVEGSAGRATWGFWAWLLGINAGSVLLPWGAVANILWWRIIRRDGQSVSSRGYLGLVVPVAVPALLAAAAVIGVERLVRGG